MRRAQPKTRASPARRLAGGGAALALGAARLVARSPRGPGERSLLPGTLLAFMFCRSFCPWDVDLVRVGGSLREVLKSLARPSRSGLEQRGRVAATHGYFYRPSHEGAWAQARLLGNKKLNTVM